MDDLDSRWSRCVGEVPGAARALAALRARYGEPHRRYHGPAHLELVTAAVARLTAEWPDPGPVVAAAFFHDAVYDPRSATNEADSAAVADQVLDELGWSPVRRAEVMRLVLATADHAVTDAASAVLLDADLAVLGAPPDDYARYVAGVRAEYGHVSPDHWRTGRSAVLQSFLGRARLFHTEGFAAQEPVARANLTAELAQLAALADLDGPTRTGQ